MLERWGWVDDPYRTSATGEGGEEARGGNGSDSLGARGFGKRVSRYIFSTSTAALWEEFNQVPPEGVQPSFTWGFDRSAAASHAAIPVPVLVVLQDLQVLLLLAVFLAVVRVWFVHMLVPEVLANPRRLEAMTRSKSSHMLSSSSYHFGHSEVKAEQLRGAGKGHSRRTGGGAATNDGGGEEQWGRCERMRKWYMHHWLRYVFVQQLTPVLVTMIPMNWSKNTLSWGVHLSMFKSCDKAQSRYLSCCLAQSPCPWQR